VTTAAGAISILRDCTIFATNMIPFAIEIICVTGSAERLVFWEGPGNSATDNIAMAGCTTRVHAVIARVVPSRTMAEADWRPAVGGMTNVTLLDCQ
jgi:hypothetical protein